MFARFYTSIDALKQQTLITDQGCWIWQGAKFGNGYGSFYNPFTRKNERVHRVMYQLVHNSFDISTWILHKCDNPLCINPDHLFAGTPKDNSTDAAKKGRISRGEKQHKSHLTEEQVRAIRMDSRPQREIAKDYHTVVSNVSSIKARRKWAWLD